MFGMQRHGNAWPIGLDLGVEGVKMLQLGLAGGQLAVRAAGRWSYPNSVTEPEARREAAVAAVRDLRRQGGFRGRRVNSVLTCGQQVFIKNIRVNRMAPEELAEAVRWEAEQRFPFPVHPERLRYFIAGEVRVGTETKDEVIVLAAPQEALDEHMALLEAMGLTPNHIEIAPIALFRVYERFLRRQADEEVVSVLVDMGYSGTRVVVARGRQIVFIKDIDVGGRNLNQAVAKELNIGEEEARDLRLRTMRAATPGAREGDAAAESPRDAMSWTVRDAVRKEVEATAKEISLCLRYCSVSFRGLHPDKAILTGGEAHDPAVQELLGEHLNVACQTGYPLRGIDTEAMAASGDRRESLTEWSVCAGLALRDVNVPQERTGRHGRDRLSA
ncbi:MAG: type IV pilus assembly protein PilM [Planctomycetota bacterium]|nr:type IV pilus assembly protein PilM [Planctomycetota bacterium]